MPGGRTAPRVSSAHWLATPHVGRGVGPAERHWRTLTGGKVRSIRIQRLRLAGVVPKTGRKPVLPRATAPPSVKSFS